MVLILFLLLKVLSTVLIAAGYRDGIFNLLVAVWHSLFCQVGSLALYSNSVHFLPYAATA